LLNRNLMKLITRQSQRDPRPGVDEDRLALPHQISS
jgi:hypothetical protein